MPLLKASRRKGKLYKATPTDSEIPVTRAFKVFIKPQIVLATVQCQLD